MIIDRPTPLQIPQLRKLWQEAFGDTQVFLDAFFETGFHPDRCLCAVENGSVVSAICWFGCTCREKPVAYLYALATAEACRGQGIAHQLMEETHRTLQKQGYVGALLVPGQTSLFDLYATMGYRVCSTLREFVCAGEAQEVLLCRVDKEEYARLRREYLPEGAVLQEGENLDFLQTQAVFYAGQGYVLAARREGETLFGMELLGDPWVAPGLVQALGCSRGTFRTPGEGAAFAMYRPLEAHALPMPGYFGLAFD